MGSSSWDGSFPQVRLRLTRGYRKFGPYGAADLATIPAAREIRRVETRFIASHPLGAQPRTDILPTARAIGR